MNTTAPPPVIEGFDFTELAVRVLRLSDRRKPTTAERENLWRAACETIQAHLSAGRNRAECQRQVCAWLWKYGPPMGGTEEALGRNLYRKFDRWTASGTLADQRRESNKARRAPKLSQADRDTLIGCAVLKYEGDLDAAWTDCAVAGKLGADLLARYPLPAGRRPRCPKAVRRQVAAEIAALMPWHRGPRQARLNGAYITRDWSGVFAADWFSSDDITLPVYYYVPDGNGWFNLTRGQFLPLIDVKSKRILEFVLIDGKSYNALSVRSLINRTCTRFGLPRRGFHFERGIWADAKLLGGGSALPWEEVESTFAERLGLKLVHSLPGNARAKVVENVAGRLQDFMAGEPGYVGRAEMTEKYERVQAAKREVEARRVHPAEMGFLSGDQWEARLHEICAAYNAKPQASQVMGGYLSPDDAWERLQPRNAEGMVHPLVKLPGELRYLLAAHCEPVTVTRNGIRLPFGKSYTYRSEITGELQGQKVLAFFDPENPDAICVTDLKKENVWTVPREICPSAYDATREELSAAHQSMASQTSYARARYSYLRAKFSPPVRDNIVDPATLAIGRQMEAGRANLRKERKRVSDLQPITMEELYSLGELSRQPRKKASLSAREVADFIAEYE